ncbi:MAG: DctP family TRAP transporter solute-binding subunit [Betaproteobacteria bacterium]|nr:DctP family TRAP transporter solute-binding subunit [Betaproteobacteria bacterium]NBO43550.1 DctP family TRAP transporter solute-binding subunit [Betaproteobacteria bacterium]NBP10542.1 DctP family TRAP transporter solute-binding subunit [Betaproteobacteria bacterium]NBP61680.1 DctP family TRAP transporter solute-binding subunit [Betaproteobacteria bacterium]NBQ08662.1 DctP family TRAP transporter solute-binding subunit [Betaproteobacteria bacterium]
MKNRNDKTADLRVVGSVALGLRFLRRSFAVGVALFALGSALHTTASQAQTRLKWAHVYETSEPYHKWAVWAGEEFKKRTSGKYEIQVFPASSLGKESDINQGLQLGTVDMIYTGASFAARSFPRLAVSYYPFTFRDADHVIKYGKSEVFRELTEGYKKATNGNTVLALTYYGVRHSTTNKPFKNCDEMKGLKMRVPDAPAYTAMPRACGANPTPIAFAEVYLALQNGTVDAQENPLPTIDAKKFYEVQKHIVMTGHIADALLTIVAPTVWAKMSAAEQKILAEVAQDAAEKATLEIRKSEAELVNVFKGRGINIIEVDRAAFQQRVLKSIEFSSMGLDKRDWDRVVAIK